MRHGRLNHYPSKGDVVPAGYMTHCITVDNNCDKMGHRKLDRSLKEHATAAHCKVQFSQMHLLKLFQLCDIGCPSANIHNTSIEML